MAKVKIINSLFKEIKKKFKGESHKIIDLLETLEDNPKKGKLLGSVGGVVIKELKYPKNDGAPRLKKRGLKQPLVFRSQRIESKQSDLSLKGKVFDSLNKNFRFYFITEGYKLKIIDKSKLTDMLIQFVRMSDKKHQQQTIKEIKKILIQLSDKDFD